MKLETRNLQPSLPLFRYSGGGLGWGPLREPSLKFETRNSNDESNSKSKIRNNAPARSDSFGHSNFEFRISNFRTSAFTLVELMISLAMVLILIVGINFVFRSATDAVGAGQAL